MSSYDEIVKGYRVSEQNRKQDSQSFHDAQMAKLAVRTLELAKSIENNPLQLDDSYNVLVQDKPESGETIVTYRKGLRPIKAVIIYDQAFLDLKEKVAKETEAMKLPTQRPWRERS